MTAGRINYVRGKVVAQDGVSEVAKTAALRRQSRSSSHALPIELPEDKFIQGPIEEDLAKQRLRQKLP